RAREVLPVKENFANAYGLTETHGVATVNGGKDLLGRGSSIGRPIPILDMKIADPQGRERPDGELGDLWIRGPTVPPACSRLPARRSWTAGCAPVTSARATARASSSWPTAPRT